MSHPPFKPSFDWPCPVCGDWQRSIEALGIHVTEHAMQDHKRREWQKRINQGTLHLDERATT